MKRRTMPGGLLRLALLSVFCTAALAAFASSAGAAIIAYSNTNTVAKTVNGMRNEDTFSLDSENFAAGGQIELGAGVGGFTKSLATQLDVFACEHGEYQLENCLTLKPNKHFSQTWTASIYAVGPGDSVGPLLTSATNTLKLKFRPSTNVACPATPEGKGFGSNCDVGGQKQAVIFKKFSPKVALPPKVIVLLTSTCGACTGQPVNLGLQASFKEYAGGEFIEEPAADEGIPSVGSDPLPEDAYTQGALNEGGWKGFQPVFELVVTAR